MTDDPRYAAILRAVAGQANIPYEGKPGPGIFGTSLGAERYSDPYAQAYPYEGAQGGLGWQGLWNKLAYSPYFQPPPDQPIKGIPTIARTGQPDIFAPEYNLIDRVLERWLGPEKSQK